jgi:U3 small nucleolar RNA-associated protein 4
VWALLVTSDGTIVSGDSEGAVQFWDGSNGTLLTRLQRHAADVLALAEWRGSVWAAGVDPRVRVLHSSRLAWVWCKGVKGRGWRVEG